MERPKLPLFPPGLFNLNFWSCVAVNLFALGLNCYMAWTYRGGSNDRMLAVEVAFIALTLVCLYTFIRHCLQIWLRYRHAVVTATDLFLFFEEHFDAFEKKILPEDEHNKEPRDEP
jgi:hypothetical protein